MYNDNPYKVEQADALGSLTSTRTHYYTEISYSNTSTTNLCVIDFSGKRTDLPPECSGNMQFFGRQQVTITVRSVVGKSIKDDGTQVLMKGYVISIPMNLLINEFQVYIQELNVVICLRDRAELVRHPYSSMNYAQLLNNAETEIIATREDRPTVQFVVNDPFRKLNTDVMYGVMFDEIFEIPITHQLDISNQCAIYTTMTLGGEVMTYTESLEAMLDPKEPVDVIELHSNLNLAIATSRREAQRFKREYRKITEQDLKNREKQVTAEIEDRNKVTIEGLKVERDKLKIALEQTTADRDRYRDQYNTIIGDHKTQADLGDINARRKETETKSKISDNNVTISDNKVAESQIKLWHVVVAASVPVVIGGIIKLLDAYVKMKTGAK